MRNPRQEGAISIRNLLRNGTVAATVLTTLSLGGTQAVLADDTYYFVSTRGLPDAERDAGVASATRQCDPGDQHDYGSAKFKSCMLGLGFKATTVKRTPDAADRAATGTVVHFNDMKPSVARSDADREADTRRCDPNGSIDYESAKFKSCMLGYGWKLAYTYHAPASRTTRYAYHPGRGQEDTWQGTGDDEGLTCRSILNGLGSVCSNF